MFNIYRKFFKIWKRFELSKSHLLRFSPPAKFLIPPVGEGISSSPDSPQWGRIPPPLNTFWKTLTSDNYPPSSLLFDFVPHIHLSIHSFQENLHDHNKFRRFHQISPPLLRGGGGGDAMTLWFHLVWMVQ